jgi:hypothetical protein
MILSGLNSLLSKNAARQKRVKTTTPLTIDLEELPDISGSLCDWLREEKKFLEVTNFTESEFTSLFHRMQPHIAAVVRRGMRPRSSWSDMLVCYLTWAHLGSDYATLATTFRMKENRLMDNIRRVRPVLKQMLVEHWFENRPRPTPLEDTPYPHIGLIFDGHSTEVCRPKAPFYESQMYWDHKNKIFALKNEVAVLASKPHYAIFASKATVGSVHDYTLHKQMYTSYVEYLTKLPNETAALPADTEEPRWGALGDRGYIGPAADTPHLRRIVPMKKPALTSDIERNRELEKIRRPIEAFFGRLTNCWSILGTVYEWDQVHFNDDFVIGVLLTNELIQVNELAEQDYEYYRSLLHLRLAEFEAEQQKQQAQYQKYKAKKAARLARIIATDGGGL